MHVSTNMENNVFSDDEDDNETKIILTPLFSDLEVT